MTSREEWMWEFFVEKGGLFARVLRAERERGVEEARLIAGLLERHGVPPGSRVIELGCGSGRVAVPLASLGYRVACLDLSPSYVEEALGYARSVGVEDRLEPIVGDAWRLDELVSGEYDAALIVWSTLIGYKLDPAQDRLLLEKIHGVVRDGGKLLILRQVDRDRIIAGQARCPRDVIAKEQRDLLVIERPRYDPVESVLENTWTYYEKRGDELRLLGRAGFKMRIYTVTELVSLARSAGWRLEALYSSLRGDPYESGRGINAVFTK